MPTDRDLLQQALEALELCDPVRVEKEVEALRVRLAQPEPEPVAWLVDDEAVCFDEVEAIKCSCDTVKPLYTAPPQREWQGLTDEDLFDIANVNFGEPDLTLFIEMGRLVQKELKEKNT